MCKARALSQGGRVLEIDGVGAYTSVLAGAGGVLIGAMELEAARQGHLAIILLATPSATGFYAHLGYASMESCSLTADHAVQQALYSVSMPLLFGMWP